MTLDAFTKETLKALPREANLVRKVYRALKAAGTPVTVIWDREEEITVTTEEEALAAVFGVDEAFMYTADRSGYVWIVLGNGWDAITDYTVNLEEALAQVNDYAMKKSDEE